MAENLDEMEDKMSLGSFTILQWSLQRWVKGHIFPFIPNGWKATWAVFDYIVTL